jgi:hypothetical protein
MNSPPAETIEMAGQNLGQNAPADDPGSYPDLSPFMFNSQLKELDGFGPGRLGDLRSRMKAWLPPSADGMPDDFRIGYLLGLQTARYCLMQSMTLALKDVKASDVL